MPKTYKTWEVIKMLTENPELKFVVDCGIKYKMSVNEGYFQFEVFNNNGTRINPIKYAGGGFNGNIETDTEWELVQEPIPFIEAIKSYSKGKTIKCELPWMITIYKNQGLHNSPLYDNNGRALSFIEILEGKWYIEG